MDVIERAELFVASPGRNYVTLKITTRDGLVGWGDATLNGRELAVATLLSEHLVPLLLGRDPGRIEDTFQYLYRGQYWRRGPITMAAIGAIDIALWDILAKRANLPLYALLGGRVRDRLLCYRHATGRDLPELIDAVDALRAQGFRAVRAQVGVPGLDTIYGVPGAPGHYEPATAGNLPFEERWDTDAYLAHVPGVLAQLRAHVGPELKLLHDAHHRLTPRQAAELGKAVEDVHLFWLEDVTPAEDQAAMRLVRAHTTTPLAIGEVFNTVWDAQYLMQERLIDYLRVAVNHVGGISPFRKTMAFAEVHGVKAGPHGPSDVSPITMGASIHLGVAIHNFAIQEFHGYDDITLEAFPRAWRVEDGWLQPGEEPGHGVSYDESFAGRHPYAQAYLPITRGVDGTLGDW